MLTDGRRIAAPLVIDGRGQRPSSTLSVGWQTFRGLEVELSAETLAGLTSASFAAIGRA